MTTRRDCVLNTMARYHAHGDVDDEKARVLCFTRAGVLATPLWTARGREEIFARLTSRTAVDGKAPRFKRHNLTTCHIEFDGENRATGRSYFMVLTDKGLDHAGVYSDVFEREGGEWLIASRTVTLDWKSDQSYVRQTVWWEPERAAGDR